MKNKLVFCFFLLFSVISIIACPIPMNVTVQFDQETFHKQRQQWQESNIKNYTYNLRAYGFVGFDGKIIVENGMFKESFPDGGFSSDGIFSHYSTIDNIYSTLKDHYDTYNNNKYSKLFDSYCEGIYVEYDNINHIPIKIQYKYSHPPMVAVDGTFDYEISDFEKSNE